MFKQSNFDFGFCLQNWHLCSTAYVFNIPPEAIERFRKQKIFKALKDNKVAQVTALNPFFKI